MSTTVDAFNEMLQQFIDELVLTFPNVNNFKKYQTALKVVRKSTPKVPLKEFYDSVKPYSDKIMKKDETFFLEDAQDIEFINDLNIQSVWGESSNNTKDAIWQYLQTLYILATTISALPQETLSAIEDIAKSFDPSNLGSLMNILGKNPV
jgi:hypothetical protein